MAELDEVLARCEQGVCCCDQDGMIIYANQAFVQQTVQSTGDYCGRLLSELIQIPPLDVIKESLRKQRLMRLPGQVLMGRIVLDLIRLGHNELEDHGFMVLVAEQDEAVSSNRQQPLLSRLVTEQEALELLGSVAGRLGHDFNNLLGAIVGCVDLLKIKLQRLLPDDESCRRQLGLLERALKRSEALTARMRGFPRRESIEFSQLGITDLVAKSVTCAQLETSSKVKIIVGELPPVVIEVVEVQIIQALAALIINALQALEGIEASQVVVAGKQVVLAKMNKRSLAPGNYIQLVISDNGPGLKGAVCDQIFTPSIGGRRNVIGRGLGIGLATARVVFHQHLGQLTLESSDGGGCRANVYLPIKD